MAAAVAPAVVVAVVVAVVMAAAHVAIVAIPVAAIVVAAVVMAIAIGALVVAVVVALLIVVHVLVLLVAAMILGAGNGCSTEAGDGERRRGEQVGNLHGKSSHPEIGYDTHNAPIRLSARPPTECWRLAPDRRNGHLTGMSSLRILVDADACPVKEEVYRVAQRRKVPVAVISNSPFRVPIDPLFERVVVQGGFDAADDWIAERADPRALIITGDILLAERCLKAGATVIGHNGRPFTHASIGGAIATRAIMADLRAGGDVVGGPAPFAKADRSRFLQALDEALVRLERRV